MSARQMPKILAGFVPSNVEMNRQVSLELSRSFIVLTAKELRKQLMTEKLTKTHLKDVAQVMMPMEDKTSQTEPTYWFRDDSAVGRRGELKVVWGGKLSEEHLQSGSHGWADQSKQVFRHAFHEEAQQNGLVTMLGKQSMPSLAEYLKNKGVGMKSAKLDAGMSTAHELAGLDPADMDTEEDAMHVGHVANESDELPLSSLLPGQAGPSSAGVAPPPAGIGINVTPSPKKLDFEGIRRGDTQTWSGPDLPAPSKAASLRIGSASLFEVASQSGVSQKPSTDPKARWRR